MVSRGLFDDMRQCTTGSDGAAPHPENGDMGQNALVLAAKFAHLLAPHYPVICDTTCTTLLYFTFWIRLTKHAIGPWLCGKIALSSDTLIAFLVPFEFLKHRGTK